MTHISYHPRRTNHLLHGVLTLFTCGLWGFVWAGVFFYNKVTHDRVTTYVTPPPAPTYVPGQSSGGPPSW